MFTGPRPDDAEIGTIEKLGATITDDAFKCTHLVTDKVRRTDKLLTAYSISPYILNRSWFDQSVAAGKFVDESKHALTDAEAEKKFKFKLKNRDTSKRILEGYTFYTTPHVKPDRFSIVHPITAAGGKFTTATPTEYDDHILIIGSADDDGTENEALSSLGYNIYSNELLLTGILTQQLKLKENILLPASSSSSSSDKSNKTTKAASPPASKRKKK